MDNIYSSLDKLIGELVDSLNLPKAVTIAINYLFELDPKLRDVASTIESMANGDINIFVDTITSISNGAFFDLKEIKNIEMNDSSISV